VRVSATGRIGSVDAPLSAATAEMPAKTQPPAAP
jgi:hypothetical protein